MLIGIENAVHQMDLDEERLLTYMAQLHSDETVKVIAIGHDSVNGDVYWSELQTVSSI